jgi:hypothetical protein
LNASFRKQFHNATTRFFRPNINDHGIRWSDMGRILAQWWRPGVSKVALDMLHWAMRSASHWRIVMAIKIIVNLPAYFVILDSMLAHNVSQRPCYGQYKMNQSHQLFISVF